MAHLPPKWVSELKKGSVQLCILALLRRGQMYGHQIMRELFDLSNGYFDIQEGTLYPALHRLEKRGYVKSRWVIQEEGNPRKYYTLTPRGTEILRAAAAEWETLARATGSILRGDVQEGGDSR